MQIAEAAAAVCDLIWLVDDQVFGDSQMSRLLRRFGPVIDIGGLSPSEAAQMLLPYRPDGVITYFDAGMVRISQIAAVLGLPFADPGTARTLVDKVAQRQALRAGGLEMPESRAVAPGPADKALRAATDIRWPAVLKPRAESGSHHTFLATDEHHARELLETLGEDRDEMVLEEYLSDDPAWSGSPYADYVSVESIVAHGKISHVAVTGRFPLAEVFRETGFCIPADIDTATQDAALAVAEAAIAALGVTTGCLHTEVKFTADGPRLIEVNGRIGGGIPDMLERAAGFPLLTASLRIALGEEVSLDALVPCDRVGYRFFLQPPAIVGTVESIEGVAEFAERDGVESIAVHRGPGARVDWRDGTRTFILAVVGVADSHRDVREAFDALGRDVTVSFLPEGPTPS